MKKLLKNISLVASTSILLAACASTPTQYYKLPNSTQKVNQQLNKPAIQMQVVLADYLQSSSIVYELAPNTIQFTSNNIWAESIQTALQNNLQNKLNQYSAQNRYTGNDNQSNQKLTIYIQNFYGSYTGHVVVDGFAHWQLNGKIVKSYNFSIKEAQNGDGYQPMLNAMDNALTQVANELLTY